MLTGTNGVLEPILNAALGDLVDPLLNGLGIRLGTMYATVHGIAQSCPDITVTPTTVAFPNTLINTSSAAQAVTIRNDGTLALTLGTITLGGAGSGHFSLSETCGATLAPGASCSASITFTPTAVGAQSATLTINSGDPDEATVVVNLSGTGTGTLPVITSDGGGAAASINVAENQTAVTTVAATGNPVPTFSIQGGADAARFSINGATGALTFNAAPDFENPTDADGNNTYIVTVRATNAVGNDEQTITVTVTNVNEAPPAPTITQPLDGATTTDTTPTISGTAQPNNTVVVHEGGTQICTATANAGGNWSCEPSSPLSQGPHTVHATASNNNNDFSAPSNNRSFTIDSVAPNPPVITTPGQNSVTTDNTPTINGTAEAGSTVNVTESGTPICSAVTSGTGTWTCTPSTALSDGPHAIVATATDTANNISALSQIRNFTVDTTGPVEPTINTPTPGQTVTDNTPTISGTAEPNSTVAVTENGAPRCTAPVDSNGNWSCDSTQLSDGPHTVVATATDAHGNVGSPSAGRAFIVDSTRPVAPIITTPANNSSTSDNRPTISGTAEADSTVTVREGGNTLCTTTATTTGTWNCTPGDPLSDGPHTITATAADSGGAGPASAPTTFTVDTVAPAAPIITAPANNSTTSDNTPAISGTAEAGSTVNVTENGAPICSAVTSGTGTWTCTPSTALSDGTHTIRATATDAANNLSPLSAPVSFTVDTTPPAPPMVSAPAANGTTNDTTPAFVGTAEPNSTVNVTENGNPICSATTDNNGNWTCTPSSPMNQGAHTVNATATDGAGNTSQPTPHPFTIDTSAVSTPNIITPAPNARVNTNTPAISGTADPNVTVTVTEGGNAVCQTSSNGSGQWNCSPASPMSEGPHTISAVATNTANTASTPATRTFTIDITPPAEAPTISNPAEGSSTSNPTPTISGTAEADSTVTVREGGNLLCTAITNGAGSWTCTSSTLNEGPHAISATATDMAGNVGPTSAPRNFTVDTSAPPAPAITTPATGSVVNESTPTIGGTAEPNSTVTVSEAGTPVCTATANGSGAWNCLPGTPLSDGEHTITASATDVAGNSGPASQPVDFTVDTAAPAAPVIFIPEAGSTTNNNTPTISGTAEPGSTANVSETGNPVCAATADGAGTWSCVPGTALSDGPHTISATATDAAGNVSPASTPVSFVVDTTPPAPPVVNAPPAGGTTNDDTPTFIGTSEPGSTVDVSENGNPICSATTDSGGVWTCTPATPMGQGPHTVDVIATDPAGNPSSPTEHSFIVDPSAVSTPSIINPAQNSSTASTTPTISGTADPDVTVAVTEGGNPVCEATADATGSWHCTPATPLSEGEHTINAVATNSIGTSSTPATRTFFVDTTAPAAPTVITPAAGSTTSDTTPVISGTAEPASTVTVRENNTILCTTATDAQGNWSCTPASELSNGPHLIEVTASDAAGNSSPTISHPFTIGESNNDDDGDGIPNDDECPNFPNCPDSDDDGTPDYLDPDDDGDGIPTANECPNHPNCPDSDGDGTPDYLDPDDDGDGIPTANECPNYPNCPDSDDDGTPDYLDPDDDGDGIPTANECPNHPNCPDSDDDGTPDYLDPDDDGDGIPTANECPNHPNCPDSDGDGTPDYLDPDDDGDGVLTEYECPFFPNCPDTDDDGRPNYLDADDDGDSVLTKYEAPDLNGDGNPADAQDTDNDGTPDYLDPDDDGDLKPTITEQPDPNNDGNPSDAVDSDGDGIPDYLDPDDGNPGTVQRLMYLPLVAR